MTRFLFTSLVLSLFFSASIFAQKTVKLPTGEVITLEKHGIICYESDEHNHGYVPAPSNNKYGAKGNSRAATFSVNYKGFPDAHKAAIDEALRILGEAVNSDVPIYVSADYVPIETAGALAGAFFSTDSDLLSTLNFNNATKRNTIYPIALIEKLRGIEITNESRPDIEITVNSNANWFTDFNNPATIRSGQSDLVTIILHEVMHGMGFAGFAGVDETTGTARHTLLANSGEDFAPFIFDQFLINQNGDSLVQLPNNSAAAKSFLESSNVFFNSGSADEPIKLYAPGEFNAGSSIYHLDQSTYANTPEGVMAPFYSSPRINNDPGLGMELLYDLGWDYTRLDHTPLGFLEDFNQSYEVEVEVTSDSGIDTTTLQLVYSQDTFKTVTTLALVYDPNTASFKASIPAPGVESAYQYYLQVTDKRSVTRSTPPDFGTAWYFMTYGIDDTDPVILHEPLSKLTTFDKGITINAGGGDFFAGIETMFLEASLNSGASIEVALDETDNGFGSPIFSGAVNFGRLLTEQDVITYRLRAVDKSLAANESFFPLNESFLTVPVVAIPDLVDSYEASFDDNTSKDFTFNGFGVELPNNFQDSCLANSVHPYPTAGNNNTLDLTAELNIPMRFNEADPTIIFDEIVMVEPGEPDVPFGIREFWDYVIVEGRKVGTNEWVSFLDGYDARDNSSWLSLYNSAINASGVSSANPFLSMYREREIDMSTNTSFVEGDTIFVRFRLFSDPGAAGWGWAINNLKIQDKNSTVAVEDVEDIESFSVFPNPTNNASEVVIDMRFKERKENLQFSMHDTNGQLIKQWQPRLQGLTYNEAIDISGLNTGVYFISVRDDVGVSVKKLLVF